MPSREDAAPRPVSSRSATPRAGSAGWRDRAAGEAGSRGAAPVKEAFAEARAGTAAAVAASASAQEGRPAGAAPEASAGPSETADPAGAAERAHGAEAGRVREAAARRTPGAVRDDDAARQPARAAAGRGLVGAAAEHAVRQALDRLPAVAPRTDEARTLEAVVAEMIRPLLAEWLEANLPAIVEREVRREIQRVSADRR